MLADNLHDTLVRGGRVTLGVIFQIIAFDFIDGYYNIQAIDELQIEDIVSLLKQVKHFLIYSHQLRMFLMY